MNQGGQNRIQHVIQALAHVLRQESQHEIAVVLEQGILSPVTAVSLGIAEMLRAIQFDDDTGMLAQEIDLHFSSAVERNGQLHIQTKTTRCCGQS